jgi:hypothetical protein
MVNARIDSRQLLTARKEDRVMLLTVTVRTSNKENVVGALPFIIGGKIEKFVQARKDQTKQD